MIAYGTISSTSHNLRAIEAILTEKLPCKPDPKNSLHNYFSLSLFASACSCTLSSKDHLSAHDTQAHSYHVKPGHRASSFRPNKSHAVLLDSAPNCVNPARVAQQPNVCLEGTAVWATSCLRVPWAAACNLLLHRPHLAAHAHAWDSSCSMLHLDMIQSRRVLRNTRRRQL